MATARPRPQVMRLTEAAAARIKALIEKADRPIAGVRVGVKNGGCAGMEYTMEYVEAAAPTDEVVEDKGVKILIDPKAVLFLLGTEMDWKVEKLSAQFVFQQPQSIVRLWVRRVRGADSGEAGWSRRALKRANGRYRPPVNGWLSGSASCDFRFGDGPRNFRIRLADDAIATVSLCSVEAGVGAVDQGLRRVALA
jgi:iron-sulfur cluster assembly protein